VDADGLPDELGQARRKAVSRSHVIVFFVIDGEDAKGGTA
jgi:hypothetical protein